MENKKSITKILLISGVCLIAIGLVMSQLRIPLTKEESDALFKNCIECKAPPTYRNIDPNIYYATIFVGIPITCSSAIIRFVL